MPAAPDPGPGGGTDPDADRPATLADWLRTRPDRDLTQLLVLRPDLALPAPADTASLAGRVAVRTSVQRAVDGLDAAALATLGRLVLAAGDGDTVVPSPDDDLAPLFERALVWGDDELVHVLPTAREALGAYPDGLGRPVAALLRAAPEATALAVARGLGLDVPAADAARRAAAELTDPDRVRALVEDVDDDEREVLDKLAAGPPVGTVRTLRPSGSDLPPALRLVRRGLLVPIDAQRVELPREVGLVLRAATDPRRAAAAPEVPLVERGPAELDGLGTTTVLELLRLAEALAASWTSQPPAVLRSGGLGVRDLRRTAKDLDVDESVAALVAETLAAAGLVNTTHSVEPVFLPTPEYDAWQNAGTASRWVTLASAWLAMTRQPSLVGLRGDRDRVIAALGPDVERGTVPAQRREVLDLLRALPPGSSPRSREDVLARLAWDQPRRASGRRPVAEAVLAEADLLGVTAAGGLTGYSRTLLDGTPAAAERALETALPAPVDHFLVQPDLTVVVPGPPEAAMGRELALVADLESSGGASVYRVTERSVRRALDAGRSGTAVAAFLAAHSRTPVPQSLSYLVEDAARRHGVLRAGTAGAYLRCDDEALLSRVVSDRGTASLGLRLLAPTVAIADADVGDLLDVLREAGFAPAAEAPDGEVVTLGGEPPRAPSRAQSRPSAARGVVDPTTRAAEVVRRLRSGDALAGQDPRVRAVAAQVPGVTSAATMELLRTAVREARLVWLGVAEGDGTTTAHTLQPISLAAGTVRGYEQGRAGLASYPVHRITAIRVVDEDDSGS